MFHATINTYIFSQYASLIFPVLAVIVALLSVQKNASISDSAVKYFILYFILGLIGMSFSAARDIQVPGSSFDARPGVFYIVATYVLLLAILNTLYMHRKTILLGLLHLVLVVIISFISDALIYLVFVSIYAVLAYCAIFYLSLQRAIDKQNIGNAMIAMVAAGVVISSILQVYLAWRANDVTVSYDLAFAVTSAGFLVIAIGFLASILIDEQKVLKNMALTDPLTKLLNRRGFDFAANMLFASSKRKSECISVIAVDIDFFKKINDTYGHDSGDIVLKTVGSFLAKDSRPSDIVARFGGEEFVVLLPNTNMEQSQMIAERIRSNLAVLNITADKAVLNVTASFGVAVGLATERELDELLKHADRALYQAKMNGRNQVVTYDNH